MIKSFRDKEMEKIFSRERSRRLPPDIQQVALRKLRMLNRAVTLEDLRIPPANHLEKLGGDRAGQYSTPAPAAHRRCGAGVRINDQWRVCFEWRDRDAFNVEITDYH